MEGLITSSIIRRGNGGVNYTSRGSFKAKMTSREKACKVLNSMILQNLAYIYTLVLYEAPKLKQT